MDTAFADTRNSQKILVVTLNPDAENQSSHSSAESCTGEEGGRKPTTLTTSDFICQCGPQVRGLKNPQAFPTNTAPTPLELTHPTLLLCAAESGENCMQPCMWMCTCLFMHELSSPQLCTDQQGSLNSPTVKCVTFNLSLPFRFCIVHYQQWLFSIQVPFRKLSSEKRTHIKEIERDNVSGA